MKRKCFKAGALLAITLITVFSTKAQTTAPDKKVTNSNKQSNYDFINDEQDKGIERIQVDRDNKVYRVELVNDKLNKLYVNDEAIPPAEWSKYSDLIADIRVQIKLNKEQALRNQEQARLNEIQAKKNQQQAVLNQIQEKKNAEQAIRNEEQARLNTIQEKKNAEQEIRNQEQENVNAIQEKKNEEQERLNEIQAKKNEEQAKENERLMKQLTADLVNDKIIPNDNSLHSLTFGDGTMTVNGVKQPDSVYKKYVQKYSRFSKGGFSFSNEGIYNGK